MAKLPEIVAAVDLGSNSFHMIVSRLRDGQLHTIDRIKEMVRLAAGLDQHRTLSETAQTRAIDCLERFGQRLQDIPRGSVRAVGTNTLRAARNSQQFLAEAESALGHPIDIISGIEEARLIYMGVAQSLEPDQQRRLVIDIGGGSTEFIIGTGSTPLKKESLYMGCVSMTNRYFPDGRITQKRMKRAVIAARQELELISEEFAADKWDQAVGASGTLRAVAKAIRNYGWSKGGISNDNLQKLFDHLTDIEDLNNFDIPEFSADRLAVFPGGIAIAYAAFKTLGIEKMQVADGALREGLLDDLMGRIYHDDVREKSINAMAQRYHTNTKHAQQIITTLHAILNQLELPDHLDQDTARQYLVWAAQIHEIGLDIAHSKYHNHGAYIIEHADLAGFSRQEQKLLATLVRVHRRKITTKHFEDLAVPWNSYGKDLAVLLRLAVILHRSRQLKPLSEFKISRKNKKLSLQFPDQWLEDHPLTHADLQQEAAYLEALEIKLRFA